MTEEPEQPQPEQPQVPKRAEPSVMRGWGKQFMGALIGMLVMAIAMQIGPSLGWQPPANRMMVALIGGAIGATLLTLDRFEQAGSRLTRRTKGTGARVINVLVGLLGLLVITSLILILTSTLGWLLDQFNK